MEKNQALSSGGRALSPTREAVLHTLERTREGQTIAELAAHLDLHENTVRMHLEALHTDGFVQRVKDSDAGSRGRPAWKWSRQTRPQSPYVALVAALAGQLARESADPHRTARAAGREWGRALAEQHAPGAHDTQARPVAIVTEILRAEGFAPVVGAKGATELRQCPLAEVAGSHPEVVCTMHLGMVQGALEALGATDAGSTLIPFTAPGVCSLSIETTDRA